MVLRSPTSSTLNPTPSPTASESTNLRTQQRFVFDRARLYAILTVERASSQKNNKEVKIMKRILAFGVLILVLGCVTLACSGTCPTHHRALRDTGETRVDGQDGKVYHHMYCPVNSESF